MRRGPRHEKGPLLSSTPKPTIRLLQRWAARNDPAHHAWACARPAEALRLRGTVEENLVEANRFWGLVPNSRASAAQTNL